MMKTIIGDLLAIKSGIVAHQVNCMGATGGLAGALLRKWPEAFKAYHKQCFDMGTDALGTALLARTSDGPIIAHVFGQMQPGANTDLDAVSFALANLTSQIADDSLYDGLPIYAPYLMGCGLGGGRWEEYEPILEKHFPAITIVKLTD